MIALIDGDIFRYRCSFAAERTKYLVELTNPSGHKEYRETDSKKESDTYIANTTTNVARAYAVLWSRKDLQPIENCLQIVKSCLENTLNEVKAVEYRIWLSGKKNFRETVAVTKPYKGNREEATKPSYYKDVGDYLQSQWSATYTDGIEADDAIGIAAMEARDLGKEYVIVSNDKDLKQIPGLHYNWVTKEFSTVSPKEAKFQLFSQILSGDNTDNVPGLAGIGPATAAKILEGAQSPEEMVDRIVAAYRESDTCAKQDGWADDYLMEQWALVYILRKPLEALGGWQHTKEGQYFCSKYLQSSDAALSLSA